MSRLQPTDRTLATSVAEFPDLAYYFVASFSQRRLWFLQQLEPDQTSYVVPVAWRLTGPLDMRAASYAINRIVERHETLRTTFGVEAGEPIQIVHPHQPFEVVVEDRSAMGKPDVTAREAAAVEANTAFDLATGPLFRFRVLQLAPNDHLLLFTTHHIVFDGWSKGIWMREFAAFYRGQVSGEPARVPELQIQYGDFAAWQQEHLSGAPLDRLLNYWKDALAGAPALLELPTDRPRPVVQAFDGEAVPFEFSKELSADLRRLCRESNTTLFMVMVAALQVLLSRMSGQQDIVLGTPIANRERLELEPLIGFFSNTLLVRGKLQPGDSFLDLLTRTKRSTLDAFAHQDMPFEKLVEALHPERSLSYSPLFQVMFALHNIPRDTTQLEGLTISGLPSGRLKTKFDLYVSVVDAPEQLRGVLELSTALFDTGTMDRFSDHYRELLGSIVANPSAPIESLSILGETERQQVLSVFNQTEMDFGEPRRIHEFLERSAARTPNAVALIDGERRITYAELNVAANRIARGLTVSPDELVGIFLDRTPQMVASIFGVLKAGAAYVPLDPTYPRHRIASIVEEARPKCVITSSALVVALPASSATVLLVDGMDSVEGDPANPKCAAQPGNLAFVLFTSGSTGRPKGVAIEHRNSVNFVQWCLRQFSAHQLAGVLLGTSIGFDMSTFEMFVTVGAGGMMVLVDNPLLLSATAAASEVTLINTVPSVMAELLRAGAVPSSVSTILLAGESLSDSLAARILEHPGISTLVNSYGPTESGYATWETVQQGKRVTIGHPLANIRGYVLDEIGNPLPIGVAGELYLAGAGVARGYLNRPDLTAERFSDDPFASGSRMYKTGDLCRWLADGRIEYLGRLDHQVKIRGFRVEPAEIEAALRSQPEVLDCVVVARDDDRGDKRLVAYVVAQTGRALHAENLRSASKSILPDYMVPSAFMILDQLPLTPNGKVDRNALPAPVYEVASSAGEAPSSQTEEIVAGIWAEILRFGRISADDDFFSLGGHSLLATQVISRIGEAFEINLPLRCIFENPTVRSLAQCVDAMRLAGTTAALPALMRVSREMPLPLSFAQQRFWVMNQLDPDGNGYNVKSALHIHGPLDATVLNSALMEISARHEVLRTIYRSTAGVPSQLLQPPASPGLHIVYMDGADEQAALREIAGAARLPFDLATGPVCRFYLYRIAPQDHIFAMVSHHICMDGSSSAILFQDLATLYAQLEAGEQAALPEHRFDYADFAAWQRNWMQGPILDEHLAYWRKHLEGAPLELQLPVDHHLETVTMAGDLRSRMLEPDFFNHLVSFCHGHKVTQFVVMLSALAITLHRWSNEQSLVIGTVAGNRPLAQMERIVGCFLNMLPLRVDVRGEDSGLDILARTRTTVLDGFSYGQCPFDAIVDAMKIQRTPDRNPIFNVGLLLQNFSEVVFKTDTLEARAVGFPRESALLDLRFVVSARAERIRLACEYKSELFDAATIDLLLGAYASTLQSLVADPAVKVSEIAIPVELEQQAAKSRGDDKPRVLVSATFTAEPLEEPLSFWLRELELGYQLAFTPNHQVFQQLLDPSSMLRANNSGFNVLLVRFEDFHQFGDASNDDKRSHIARGAEDLIGAVRSAAAGSSANYIVCCCPPSSDLLCDPEWSAFLAKLEQSLVERLKPSANVLVVTSTRLNELYPVAEYEDKVALAVGHVPYTTEFSTALATMIIRCIWGLRGPGYKVIALDCDNTLWSGVCGEDGTLGVKVGAPQRALQLELLKQREQGMLLVLCSKNNEPDAWDVFDRNPDMLLKREHITAYRINWEPKPGNLQSMAKELGLGIDSFVFIDDSPVECSAVETQCPEVLTLQLPEDENDIPAFLNHIWAFDHYRTTDTDRRRSELYREESEREKLRTDQSLEDFIKSLQLNIQIGPLTEENVGRVAQLTQRSNQFNSTTIRRQDPEVRELITSPELRCWTVHLSDRFGDYGLIGVVIYSVVGPSLVVESFLMSCRALGRRVEHTILVHLWNEAQRMGLAWVDVQFSASPKNAPVFHFLESLPSAARIDGGYRFAVTANSADTFGGEVSAA